MELQQARPAAEIGLTVDQFEAKHLQLVLTDRPPHVTVRMPAPLARVLLAEIAARDELIAELHLTRSEVEGAVCRLDTVLGRARA